MAVCVRLFLFASALSVAAFAAPPPELSRALEYLRDQKSYSWEVINADPGPVAQQLKTRRGELTMVQQNNSPHIKGSIDRNGDTLIQREWTDGIKLDTIILADGTSVTRTPEGWMTNQDILAALAQEQLNHRNTTPRLVWLRRADRPDLRRPHQELTPMLNSAGEFESREGSFLVKGSLGASGGKTADAGPAVAVAITLNLSGGLIRDYEVKVDSTRTVTRARVSVPISDERIVILTYLPVRKIEIPEEAREKLKAAAAKG